MTFLRLVGALKVASLILQHMAGALHMMKMIGTSCSRQVEVMPLRLHTIHARHQAMTGMEPAWMIDGQMEGSMLRARMPMTGLLCGGLTILQMMLLAETQVCTGLHGRATTLKALTIARRLYMPTMLHIRGRAHIKESVMGTLTSVVTTPLHPPHSPALAATAPPVLMDLGTVLIMILEHVLSTWIVGCQMETCTQTTGTADICGMGQMITPGSSIQGHIMATMQMPIRPAASWISCLFPLHGDPGDTTMPASRA